ncbi:MAG: galactokinase, partial [Clostridia bacterium]|nr:galactokinase [Clostridia bacterium]
MFIKIQEAYKRGAEAMKQYIFSAPGRTEISGNHTDHQHGCVLAASVNLKTTAKVVLNGTSVIRIQSEGYPAISIDLTDLSVRDDEKNSTAALVRGVAAAFAQRDAKLSGFDAQVSSTVLPGSGLSSSAAFEVMIGNILNGLFFENRLDAVEIAKIGQYAENVYFGKPCGLMDQMASSVGSMVFIDFKDEQNPQVERIAFDFAATGHALCIIDTGADHADLTDEYAAITRELKTVCRFFGKEVLRDVPEDAFYKALPEVRAAAGDRAVLRAIHVYNENRRVLCQKQALLDGDFDTFLAYVKESGKSSWCCL